MTTLSIPTWLLTVALVAWLVAALVNHAVNFRLRYWENRRDEAERNRKAANDA